MVFLIGRNLLLLITSGPLGIHRTTSRYIYKLICEFLYGFYNCPADTDHRLQKCNACVCNNKNADMTFYYASNE